MKKQFREITINDEKYSYSIKANVDGDSSNRVSFFKNRKFLFEKITPYSRVITPSVAASFIDEHNRVIESKQRVRVP